LKLERLKKINDNHYDLKLKLTGSIQQKLDNFPTDKTYTLVDIKCANAEEETQLKKLFKL
jgi:predicted methyltransferase